MFALNLKITQMENIDYDDFLDWYFSGSDQEKQYTLIGFGELVKKGLEDSGFYSITIDDLINEANIDAFLEDTNKK